MHRISKPVIDYDFLMTNDFRMKVCLNKQQMKLMNNSFSYIYRTENLFLLLTRTSFTFEPVHEKTNNLGFRLGPTLTSLYSHRSKQEA